MKNNLALVFTGNENKIKKLCFKFLARDLICVLSFRQPRTQIYYFKLPFGFFKI